MCLHTSAWARQVQSKTQPLMCMHGRNPKPVNLFFMNAINVSRSRRGSVFVRPAAFYSPGSYILKCAKGTAGRNRGENNPTDKRGSERVNTFLSGWLSLNRCFQSSLKISSGLLRPRERECGRACAQERENESVAKVSEGCDTVPSCNFIFWQLDHDLWQRSSETGCKYR